MMSNWQHVNGGTYAAITNWATFAKELALGTGGGQQELHMPLFDTNKSTPAGAFGAMVIFQPEEGAVAALVAGPQRLTDAVKASDMVGEVLELPM